MNTPVRKTSKNLLTLWSKERIVVLTFLFSTLDGYKIGIFPGSFDPITKGHEYVINKAATMVDELIVGIEKIQQKNTLILTND